MTEPHASWASIYDEVYEQSFGRFYRDLTNVTVETIANTVSPAVRIVDFGARTGRLSVPLSSKGYRVLAVEPCKEMLNQLTGNPDASGIETFNGKMQEFETDELFDMAICVFIVLLYLLDEKNQFKLQPMHLCQTDTCSSTFPIKLFFRIIRKNTNNESFCIYI